MHRGRVFLIIMLAWWGALSATADPANFIVGPFTFTRPGTWQWNELPEKSHAAALLMIVDTKAATEAQVLISFTPSSRDEIVSNWKSYFVEPPAVTHRITPGKIKNSPITYLTVEGTYRVKGKLKAEYALLGFIVESGKKNVCGRLIGPKAMVKQLESEFKKMIEDALKEE